MKEVWLALVLTLCVGPKAMAYSLTVASSAHGTVSFSVEGITTTTARAGEVVTITVTPAEGYDVDSVAAQAFTPWSTALSRRSTPGLVKDIGLNGEGDILTFIMPEADVQLIVNYTLVNVILSINVDNNSCVWYTLDGRQLQGKPTAKGFYIVGGRKVMIK
jgi:hypothetical protein